MTASARIAHRDPCALCKGFGYIPRRRTKNERAHDQDPVTVAPCPSIWCSLADTDEAARALFAQHQGVPDVEPWSYPDRVARCIRLGTLEPMWLRGITPDEERLLQHVSRYGSDGYPITSLGRRGARWSWGPFLSVKAHPGLFPTRKAAVESFEKFVDILIDAKAGRL